MTDNALQETPETPRSNDSADQPFEPGPHRAPAYCRGSAQKPASPPPTLPFLLYPQENMELFDPARHLPDQLTVHCGPSEAQAPLPLALAARAHPRLALIPRREDCHALWERYAMLDNIRAHSAKVAEMAHAMALLALRKGLKVLPEEVLAAALLHDLGKTYTIAHGGNHAQLGASWVMRETGNGRISQAVLHHVHWPWAERLEDDSVFDALFVVLAIVYADKRVKHDAWASLDERFDDLIERYGVNEYVKGRIAMSHAQGKYLEQAFSRRLGVNLNECIADSGRLVQRA
ncbi:HD domain-containing protein [Desulfovibrio sp. OttesenSCG-928-A18]|nr:HD domain-containing protein [Desulfovibrio sp. OttesenSCG-928-A18]